MWTRLTYSSGALTKWCITPGYTIPDAAPFTANNTSSRTRPVHLLDQAREIVSHPVERNISPAVPLIKTDIPSQTIKVWLSKELAAQIERDGCAIRFDYQVHEVRHFEDSSGRQQATRSL